MIRLRRRGSHSNSADIPGGRRVRRVALYGVALLAVAGITLETTGTLSQFTAQITNNNNHVLSGSVGLTETHPGEEPCVGGNGQWTDCDNINKYADATLSATNTSVSQTVDLTNTGTVDGRLFLLPSACTDSLTGAGGGLCDLVEVTAACPGRTVGPVTLNNFFAQRDEAVTPAPSGTPPPAGYSMGTIAAGQTITCTFTLDLTGTVPSGGGDISQPLSWRLTSP